MSYRTYIGVSIYCIFSSCSLNICIIRVCASRSTGTLSRSQRKTGVSLWYGSFVGVDLVVDATATNTGLARPGINVRACLAGLHVSHAALVPKIADLRVVAFLRSILRAYFIAT